LRSERGFVAPLLLVAAVALVAVAVAGLIVVINSEDEAPPDQGGGEYELRAIGDSVTAGWGHYPDGAEVRRFPLLLGGCVPPPTPNGKCQSPRKVAYPAVFARERGIPLARPGFENLAIAGAEPADWLPGGPFAGRLDRVVAEDPDLTVLTLGANPLLSQFLFQPAGAVCVRRPEEAEIRRCVAAALADVRVVERLARVYSRLLATPEDGKRGLVAVLQYHETVPLTLRGTRIDLLFEQLRSAISAAVARAREANPSEAERLLLVEPPSFAGHDCGGEEPWVLESDFCIHPSAAGHEQLARALEDAVAGR
jgi:lysophospholipase L1-like esterase